MRDVFELYISCDGTGEKWLHSQRPHQESNGMFFSAGSEIGVLPAHVFPDMRAGDPPRRVLLVGMGYIASRKDCAEDVQHHERVQNRRSEAQQKNRALNPRKYRGKTVLRFRGFSARPWQPRKAELAALGEDDVRDIVEGADPSPVLARHYGISAANVAQLRQWYGVKKK